MKLLIIVTFTLLFSVLAGRELGRVGKVVKEISDAVEESYLLKHHFLTGLQNGAYRDADFVVQQFAKEHYTYSRNFLKYLNAVKAKLEDEDAAVLGDNVEEESGHYSEEDFAILGAHGVRRELIEEIPHRVLIKKFLESVGLRDEDLQQKDTIGGRFTQYMIDVYENANPCEGLAVIGFAIEQTVPTLYNYIWEGLKRHSTLSQDDYVFFPLHILVDDGHADHLKEAFMRVYEKNPYECRNAASLVRQVLARRILFFDELHTAIMSEEEKRCSQDVDCLVEEISSYVDESYLMRHDFLTSFANGDYKFPDHAVKRFAKEHYSYSRNFLKYLNAVKAKLSEEDAAVLGDNVEEESGHYSEEDFAVLGANGVRRDLIENTPHRVLIKQFLNSLGLRDEDLMDEESIGGRFTRYMIDTYEQSNPCEGLAVIGFAIEQTVPTLYDYIWTGLKEHSSMHPDDFVFFPLHILVDDGHADHLKEAFTRVYNKDPESCADAPKIVREVVNRRIQFFDELDKAIREEEPQLCAADAECVVQELSEYVDESYLLNHDFLRNFRAGNFYDIDGAVRRFAQEHYSYSRNFLKYLNAVKSKLNDEDAAVLGDNVEEESGHYSEEDFAVLSENGVKRELIEETPHRVLIKKFLTSVGLKDKDLMDENSIGGRFTRYMIDTYEEANPCEGLAVIGFAIEQTVPILYDYIWQGLKYHSNMNPDDYVFFPLHILVDDGHADHLKEAFIRVFNRDPESCENATAIVHDVLERRIQFFDELEEAIRETEPEDYSTPSGSYVSVSNAVLEAKAHAKQLEHPDWSIKEKIAMACRILADQGHGKTLSGQVTCRSTHNGRPAMYTEVYGKSLDEITPADIIKIDENLQVVEGEGHPNMATRFHLHVYEKRPDLECLVHTHPLHTSALAQLGVPLLVSHMDTMALYDDVPFLPHWPGIPFGDWEGELISSVLGNKNAGLLAHHGLIVGGLTIEQTTYRAYFFERAAQMQLLTMAANGGSLDGLPEVERDLAEEAREWRASDSATKAHFYSWARQALKNGHDDVFEG